MSILKSLGMNSSLEDENLRRLREHALVQGLSEREFSRFSRLCNLRHYEAGEVIYRKNYPQSVLFLVVLGRVELHQDESLESPMIGWAGESDYLGVTEFLCKTSRAESALARTPVTLYAISDRELHNFFDLFPRTAVRLLLNLGHELIRRQQSAAESDE